MYGELSFHEIEKVRNLGGIGMVKEEVTVEIDLNTSWDKVMQHFERNRYKIKSRTPKTQLVVERGSKAASVFSGEREDGGHDLDYRTITVDFTPVGANSTRLRIDAQFTWITAGKWGRTAYLKNEIELLLKEFDQSHLEEMWKEVEEEQKRKEKAEETIDWYQKQGWAVEPIRVVKGHGDYWVHSCAFSPDGRHFLSGADDDHTLRLWDVKTCNDLRTFKGHTGQPDSCTFTSDGSRIVSGARDCLVILWDANSGKRLKVYNGHSANVNKCCFSPDETRMISCSDDRLVIVWDVESGKKITILKHESSVEDCAFSPDGATILTAPFETRLKLWDAQNGRLIRTFTTESGDLTEKMKACAFSPDGAAVVGGSSKNTIRIWDVKTGQLSNVLEAKLTPREEYTEGVQRILFSANGSLLFAGFYDGLFRAWDARTYDVIKTLKISVISKDWSISPDNSLIL